KVSVGWALTVDSPLANRTSAAMQPIRLFAFRCTNPEEVIPVSFFLTSGATVVLRSEHASSNCLDVCIDAASARRLRPSWWALLRPYLVPSRATVGKKEPTWLNTRRY